jgi:predicted membrane GTPase involved in stress response
MSLDEALDFIVADELVEVTPQNFRMRKKELSTAGRSRHRAAAARERAN